MNYKKQIENHFIFKLSRVDKELRRRGNKLMHIEGFDIQFEQIPPLMMAYIEGEVSQQQIADELDRDKSSINRTITWLEKNGYVSVSQDSTDKRKNVIKTSRKGDAFASVLFENMNRLNDEILSELTAEEIKVMDRVFNKVISIVKKEK
jgi:MarR family transcriptional repressor of mepA